MGKEYPESGYLSAYKRDQLTYERLKGKKEEEKEKAEMKWQREENQINKEWRKKAFLLQTRKGQPHLNARIGVILDKCEHIISDIVLQVCVSDSIRNVHDSKLWTLVGSDGDDFINLSIWDKSVEKFERELGKDFVGKSFSFQNFSAFSVNQQFNMGSSAVELRAKQGSTVVPVSLAKQIHLDDGAFLAFLKNKHELVLADFNPLPIGDVLPEENTIEIEGDLICLKPIRNMQVRGSDCRVVDFDIIDGGKMATITAWNVMCDLINHLLLGKEGSKIRLQSVLWKAPNAYSKGAAFTFTNDSKIGIVEKMDDGEKADSLSSLVGKEGFCNMEIRVRVARKQGIQNLASKIDGTMVTDSNHKCQLFFPNTVQLPIGQELTLKSGTVKWSDSGVLSVSAYTASSLLLHNDKLMGAKNLADFSYPE